MTSNDFLSVFALYIYVFRQHFSLEFQQRQRRLNAKYVQFMLDCLNLCSVLEMILVVAKMVSAG